MEADAGRDVEIKVCVMDPMEAPESRNEVKHGMLQVDREIEACNSQHEGPSAGQAKIVQ